jgi:tetratricopeptide (TPR) repeat protein
MITSFHIDEGCGATSAIASPVTTLRHLAVLCRLAAVIGLLLTPATVVDAQVASDDPAQKAPKLSVDWKRLQSEHFSVVGNASERDLRQALETLEDFRSALASMFPSTRLQSPEPTTAVVFRDDDNLSPFKPRDGQGRRRDNVVGYFTRLPDMNYMVMAASSGANFGLPTILHEYTHYVVEHNTRRPPSWLNEGLAEFYSTFEPRGKDGTAMIGLVPPGRLAVLQRGTPLPIESILEPESASRLMRQQWTAPMFYARSWVLVHYLTIGHEGRRDGQLSEYLASLARGIPTSTAFRQVFGDPAKLEVELQGYSRKFAFPALRFTPAQQERTQPVTVEAQRLSQADVDVLKGELFLMMGRLDDADESLARALKALPRATDARLAHARLQLAREEHDEAIQTLREIAASEPQHFSTHFYLGVALEKARQFEPSLTALTQAAKLLPNSSVVWQEISGVCMALGDMQTADRAMERALLLDDRPGYYRGRARLAWTLGLDRQVIADERRFLDLDGLNSATATYAVMESAMSAWRLNDSQAVVALATTVRALIPADSWSFKLLSYAMGELSSEKLIAAASTNGERTEAYAYTGFRDLAEGRQDQGLTRLRWVRDRGERDFSEYSFVVEELKKTDRATASAAR